MNKIYIYGLVDPETNQLRYIGKSKNPESRYRKHLQDSKKKITYKDKWIYHVLFKQKKPELIILDFTLNDDWEEIEKFYIAYFKFIGAKLTNLTEGGDNPPSAKGRVWTAEQLKRISENNKGKKRSEETKKNISLSKKGKPLPHLNGKERSLSHRKNISLSLKGRTSPNKGKKFDDQYRKKLSDAHSHQKKKVIQINKNGEIIKIWDSIADAKKEYKNNHICECCLGKVKTAAGFKWKYKNE